MKRLNAPRGQKQLSDGIELFALPARVALAHDRRDEGWILVVTDPAQKLYWWRFQAGSPDAAASQAAQEFQGKCQAASAPGELGIFCGTDRRVLASVSTRKYLDEGELLGKVQTEFDNRANSLDSGFDYFDKVLNLWTVLGSDFFIETGHAQNAGSIRLKSVKRTTEGWELKVSVLVKSSATLLLSPKLELITSRASE